MRIVFLFSLLVVVLNGDVFSKGKANLGLYVGGAQSFGYSYTIIGVSGEYYVADNLSLGGMYRNWSGSGPTQNEVSLYSNYFLPVDKRFKPYVGAFGRKTYIDSPVIDDFGSYGFRGGLSIITSNNSYISLGYAIEYFDSCVESEDCYRSYPELSAGISF
ncbi:hypothetical protein [Sulfurimonas sp.]